MIPSRSDEGCSLAAFFVREVWSLLKFKDYDYRYPQDGATQVRKMDLQENKRNAIAFYETSYKDITFVRAIAEGNLVALHSPNMA